MAFSGSGEVYAPAVRDGITFTTYRLKREQVALQAKQPNGYVTVKELSDRKDEHLWHGPKCSAIKNCA